MKSCSSTQLHVSHQARDGLAYVFSGLGPHLVYWKKGKEISEPKVKAKWIHASIADWEKEFCKWNVCLFILSTELFHQSEKKHKINCKSSNSWYWMQVNSSAMWEQLRKALRKKRIILEVGRKKKVLQKSRWNSDLGTWDRQESLQSWR